MPGRVGSPWLGSGKTDFVANFCGTYSMYPSQMFDRRVETLNSLYLGLRAYNLSTKSKMEVKTAIITVPVPIPSSLWSPQ